MIEKLAESLREAAESREPCAPLTAEHPDLTIEDAYAIQGINLERRIEAGARLVGRKIGLTSVAVQEWLGVSEPDFGGLLDTMAVPNGGSVDSGALLQPRVEGELAFVLMRDLEGPGVTPHQVIAATDFLLPSIEIIDSRVRNWKFKIQDTIADNASSGFFAVGSRPVALAEIDTRRVGLTLRKNGRVVSTGAGSACMGDPIAAVVWLANKLGSLGTPLRAGDIILSGALGPVVPVEPGDSVTVEIGSFGEVGITFESIEEKRR